MNAKNRKPLKHKSLLIFLGLIVLLCGSFFIYKYVYIYTERKKYDSATVTLQKVADDLRTQGIETQFSKGCGKNIQLNNSGPTICSISLTHKSEGTSSLQLTRTDNFSKALIQNGFKIKRDGLHRSDVVPLGGYSIFSYGVPGDNYVLQFSPSDKDNGSYSLILSYTKNVKFKLF